MEIEAVIPVAPEEPVFIVKESIENMEEMGLNPVYVLDDPSPKLLKLLDEKGTRYVVRECKRGRRAGAINDSLKKINSKYVALFDVDSRSTKEFIKSCIEKLEGDKNIFLASGPRFITNEEAGFIPLAVSAEYRIIGDLYRLLSFSNGFIQFNGLIGVVRRSDLGKGLNEQTLCEDVDFSGKAYLEGKEAALVQEMVGEQAPPSWKEYYSQRVRWLGCALNELSRRSKKFFRSKNSVKTKFTWFSAMFTPLIFPFFSPLIPFSVLYGFRLKRLGDKKVLFKSFLLPLLGLTLLVCSLTAIFRHLFGKKNDWETTSRT